MAEIINEAKSEAIKLSVTGPKIEEAENLTQEKSENVDLCHNNNDPSTKLEEDVIKKKYGGLLPKRPPLISKDNERAFFDSADWALGKVGAPKNRGPLEALRPKLEPTKHEQVRSRSAYAPTDDGQDVCMISEENQNSKSNGNDEINSDRSTENQINFQN
ncbi:cAMP-regulated phosphoprotein 19-related protein [Striga asiatica]|uniref:cAMP-regulated phosphoprotein 19-related protein n=1 Tax=Striga asiatica TaxID=4170 RepID=A0A5A7QGX9_STRAF|nr:cAMP-regulated phosphoprotein 19-related protein [Striga asiatica]